MIHTFHVWLPTDRDVAAFLVGVVFTIVLACIIAKILEYFDIP